VTGIGLSTVMSGFVNVVLLAGGFIYTAVVLRSYVTARSLHRPRFRRRLPVRSAQRLAVWVGVQGLTFIVRVAKPILAILSEASAELGEWFLSRYSPERRS